ncbi:acyl-CoA carboxylase epsilon subunit [Streptacidiphilus sp. ASG 303]|uniref:acyl-CoA carboxylase epsilon subunit n=1 Tax=Streptomycetaceae TaxID=2062 RepID=UPI001E3FE54B|nr:acyl-CoA carboxylase epsilon subunit [Streptacidiphilus sp. ASG 303]MCD0485292.1 acyl-CoA carboxylase subunit epsilon [Streptacidiphilus sp. ASG 303]
MTQVVPAFQIVRGSLTDEELAALTAVLLARAAAGGGARQQAVRPEPVARWQRLERRPSYDSPLSWQTAA